VILVLVSLKVNPIVDSWYLTLASIALVSSRVPFTPMIQSSAYLMYEIFLKLGSLKLAEGINLLSLANLFTNCMSPLFFALDILLWYVPAREESLDFDPLSKSSFKPNIIESSSDINMFARIGLIIDP